MIHSYVAREKNRNEMYWKVYQLKTRLETCSFLYTFLLYKQTKNIFIVNKTSWEYDSKQEKEEKYRSIGYTQH